MDVPGLIAHFGIGVVVVWVFRNELRDLVRQAPARLFFRHPGLRSPDRTERRTEYLQALRTWALVLAWLMVLLFPAGAVLGLAFPILLAIIGAAYLAFLTFIVLSVVSGLLEGTQ